jgi:hypothetical protein
MMELIHCYDGARYKWVWTDQSCSASALAELMADIDGQHMYHVYQNTKNTHTHTRSPAKCGMNVNKKKIEFTPLPRESTKNERERER